MGTVEGKIGDVKDRIESVQNSVSDAAQRVADNIKGKLHRVDDHIPLATEGDDQTNLAYKTEVLVNHAHQAFMTHDYEGAISALSDALELMPRDVELLAERARASMFLGKFSAATKDLDQALAIEPTQAYVWVDRAMAKLQLRDLEGALHDLNRANLLQPGQYNVLVARSLTRLSMWDVVGWAKDMFQAMRVMPSDWFSQLRSILGIRQFLMTGLISLFTLAVVTRATWAIGKRMLRRGVPSNRPQQQQHQQRINIPQQQRTVNVTETTVIREKAPPAQSNVPEAPKHESRVYDLRSHTTTAPQTNPTDVQ